MSGPEAHFVLPLDLGGNGPRVAVKDVIDIAGLRTAAGSRALSDRPVAVRHAAVVERLLDAGCRIVGKANLHELAFGMTGLNEATGTPLNPRYPSLVPGGSSSGSATAVTAGLCDWALGTDTGGSIRVPAACCGIVGFKPSFGRLSREGLTPAQSSLDCVGPLARDVATVEAAMAILDPTFGAEEQGHPPRIGAVRTDALPEVADAVRLALRRSSYALVEVDLPGLADAFSAAMTIMNAEMFAAFGHLLASGALGADIDMRLRKAREIPQAAVDAAERVRTAFRAEVDAALADHGLDALALPTLPAFPVTLAQASDAAAALGMSRLVRPFNLSGHPALTLPIGEGRGGPIALQLVGAMGQDRSVLAAGRLIEGGATGGLSGR